MESQHNQLDLVLSDSTNRVELLLTGINPMFDGMRNNTWVELPFGDEFSVLIASSSYLDGRKDYHVAKHLKEDAHGYLEGRGYHWGEGIEPSVCITRTHKNRLLLSSIHQDDTHFVRPIKMSDYTDINILLEIADRAMSE